MDPHKYSKAPLRKEVRLAAVRLLRAGPSAWCEVIDPPVAQWLADAARTDQQARDVRVAFLQEFGWSPEGDELRDDVGKGFGLLQTQRMAFERWCGEISSAVRDLYPALEVIVVSNPEPSGWVGRWRRAGGSVYDGRCIALIGDPAWAAFSEYGHPVPPFDWSNVLDLDQVSRSEAMELGVLR